MTYLISVFSVYTKLETLSATALLVLFIISLEMFIFSLWGLTPVLSLALFLIISNQANQRWFLCPECWFPLRRNQSFLTQEYSVNSLLFLPKYLQHPPFNLRLPFYIFVLHFLKIPHSTLIFHSPLQ